MKHVGKKLAVLTAAVVLSLASMAPAWAKERLATIEDLYWNEDDDNENKMTEAVWEEVEDAYRYEVYLYREGSKVAEIETKNTSYNFKKKMTQEGDYTFRVRPLAKSSDHDYTTGYWSDYSDALYITESRAEWNKNGASETTTTVGGPGSLGEWVYDGIGWWYRKSDGTYPVNGWFQDPADQHWYMFGPTGYMMTGWIDGVNGARYYCDPQGTPSGAMVTGTYVIDGVAYNFDASGALIGG